MARKPYDRHLGFRIDSETHYKIQQVAEYEGRSMTAHILYLLRQNIMNFEKTNGTIE